MTETLAPYEFKYAMQRLRDAIDYAQTDGDFQQARIWSNYVEAAYNADIKAEQELTANANEGAHLMHSLATGGETSVLSRLDNGVDAVDAQRWQDAPEYKEAQQVADKFNFETVAEQEF